jgi:hypothetical protein
MEEYPQDISKCPPDERLLEENISLAVPDERAMDQGIFLHPHVTFLEVLRLRNQLNS